MTIFFFGHAAPHVGASFADQGWNLCPLQWKCGVSTTGPPGKPHRDHRCNGCITFLRGKVCPELLRDFRVPWLLPSPSPQPPSSGLTSLLARSSSRGMVSWFLRSFSRQAPHTQQPSVRQYSLCSLRCFRHSRLLRSHTGSSSWWPWNTWSSKWRRRCFSHREAMHCRHDLTDLSFSGAQKSQGTSLGPARFCEAPRPGPRPG